MKKITLLITLMLSSFAFSQAVVIENFQTPSTYTLSKFEGLSDASIVADPAVGGTRQQCLKMVSVSTGNPWQGAEIILSGSKIGLTTVKTITFDVYATQAFTMLAKVENGAPAPNSAASANYTTPNAWQTLTFSFTISRDNQGLANGDYGKLVFFPNWKADNSGFNTPPANFALHIDNVTGIKVATAPAFVPPAAPTPSIPDAQVFNLFGDTGGFTTKWVPVESFGGTQGTLDLDPTTAVNTAIKMDFSLNGWGQRLDDAAPISVSSYGFFNFDYYIQSGTANAPGSLGNQFYIDLIHRTGATNVESFYGFGPAISSTGNASEHVKQVMVFDSWQRVSIPLSAFVGFDATKFLQWKLGSSSDLRSKVVFFDNIYFSVNNPALGTESFQASKVRMYPNPSKNSVTIDANGSIERVAVYSILGQEVMSKSPKSNSTTLQTSSLQRGTYIVRSTVDGKTSTSKLVKE